MLDSFLEVRVAKGPKPDDVMVLFDAFAVVEQQQQMSHVLVLEGDWELPRIDSQAPKTLSSDGSIGNLNHLVVAV